MMRRGEEGSHAGNGPLFARLAGFSVLPTLLTTAALIGFFFVWRESRGPRDGATLLLGCLIIAGIGLAGQLLWLRRTARSLTDPVEELVRALDTGEPPPTAGLSSRVDWEIRLLYHRVDVLLRQQRSGRQSLEGYEATRRCAEDVAACIDRIGTEEPPGDATACTGHLEPVGAALRALMERLDRREIELVTLFDQLGTAMTDLGERVSSWAGVHENAYMALLELISGVRDLRRSVESILKEVGGAAGAGESPSRLDRIRLMVERVGVRLEDLLLAIGNLSTRMEAEASRGRDLARRGKNLGLEVDGVRRRVERGPRRQMSSKA